MPTMGYAGSMPRQPKQDSRPTGTSKVGKGFHSKKRR